MLVVFFNTKGIVRVSCTRYFHLQESSFTIRQITIYLRELWQPTQVIVLTASGDPNRREVRTE